MGGWKGDKRRQAVWYQDYKDYLEQVAKFRRKWEKENNKRKELGLPLLKWPLGLAEYDEELKETRLAERTMQKWEQHLDMEREKEELLLQDREENKRKLAEINATPLEELTDTQKIVRHNLMLVGIGWGRKIDPREDCGDELLKRFEEYLTVCTENNIIPTIEGFYICTGHSKQNISGLRTSGKTSKSFNEAWDYIKQILCSQIIDNGQNGKSNPIFTIFQLRNNYGYTNDDKMNAEKNETTEKVEERNAEELAEKYRNLPD